MEEIKQNPFQFFTICLVFFTFSLSLYILDQVDLGIFAQIIKKILTILLTPFALLAGTFGIDKFLWNTWKKIPVLIHALISLVYIFLIGMLLPISYQEVKNNYGKSE